MSDEARNFRLSKDVLPSRYELRFELEFDTWTSTGRERITLRTSHPTREIVLHALDLDIQNATLDGVVARNTTYDVEAQTATLRFERVMPPGEHTLEISWVGGIRESLRGLYRSLRGEERYAATQFEAADARRAFPCFDEPEFKARFGLELVHPADNAAIANMPIFTAPRRATMNIPKTNDSGNKRLLAKPFGSVARSPIISELLIVLPPIP